MLVIPLLVFFGSPLRRIMLCREKESQMFVTRILLLKTSFGNFRSVARQKKTLYMPHLAQIYGTCRSEGAGTWHKTSLRNFVGNWQLVSRCALASHIKLVLLTIRACCHFSHLVPDARLFCLHGMPRPWIRVGGEKSHSLQLACAPLSRTAICHFVLPGARISRVTVAEAVPWFL